MTTETALALIAVGIPGVISLVVAFRSSSTTKQISDRSASLEEFKELRTALRDELNEALRRIDALEETVETERNKREKAEEHARAAHDRADRAEHEVAELRQRVHHLEDVLRRNDIDPDEETP